METEDIKNTKDIRNKVDYWNDQYWPELQKATDDSEEKLEKMSTTISVGAIGLLLGTLGFGHKSLVPGYAIVSLCAFVAVLCIYMGYHIFAIRKHNKQFDAIREYVANPKDDDSYLIEMIKKSNSKMDVLSSLAVLFLLIGISFFAIYLLNNIS